MTFSIFYNATPITYLKFTPQFTVLLSKLFFFFPGAETCLSLRGVSCKNISFSYYVCKNMKNKKTVVVIQYVS